MESPVPPPGFADSPPRGPSLDEDLPPHLADLPSHIRDKIDLLVQNDLDINSQLEAIDALLLEDARLAEKRRHNDTFGDSENDSGIETLASETLDSSLLAKDSVPFFDIDKYIASMAVPPPPGNEETKQRHHSKQHSFQANGTGSEADCGTGVLDLDSLPPPPNMDSSMDDEFDVFLPPSEFNIDIDLSQVKINEILEDKYLQYVIPPPPSCSDDTPVFDAIPVVPPVEIASIPDVPAIQPPSPLIETSVSQLTKMMEARNINLTHDESVRRAVVRPLQSEGKLGPPLPKRVSSEAASGSCPHSPETPSSVELNPKHSALWRPSEIRSADSSPVHKGKDFLSAALRGSTGTLNRRGRVPPPPPPRRSSIQTESACSSRSESPCSTPDAPSGIPRARHSGYVNVLNFGNSAPASPVSLRRKNSTNSDSGSTNSSANSSVTTDGRTSNVQKIKVLLESARLTRTPGAGSSRIAVRTGGGEQPATRDSTRDSTRDHSTRDSLRETTPVREHPPSREPSFKGSSSREQTPEHEQRKDSNNHNEIKITKEESPYGVPSTFKKANGSSKLRSTFKPDESPTEMPNRTVLDDLNDCEIDLTSDLDLSSDLEKQISNNGSSKFSPKYRSPSFQRKLLAFEISKRGKDSGDMDSAPKESPKSPLLGRDGVPRRSSLNTPQTSLTRHGSITRLADRTKPLRSLFGKSDSERGLSDTETSSCPTSPRTNTKSFTLGRSGLRGFGLNNNNRENSRKGIPTRVVKPMMTAEKDPAPSTGTTDWVPKNRNSIASTLSHDWNPGFDYEATYRTFTTFKDSKRNKQPTFSTFKNNSKSATNNVRRSPSLKKKESNEKIEKPEEGVKANMDKPGNTSSLDESPLRTSSPTQRICEQDLSSKLYDSTDVFQEVDKDTDLLVVTITKTLRDLNLPSCRKPSEEFQGHKDRLVTEARQFVTDSKLLVSSATQSMDKLVDHVISSMHTLARLVGHGQDVMLTVRSVPQAHNLGARLQEVVHAYRLTVAAAHRSAGKPLGEPPMKLLMKQATNLAAILSQLMKTLKILENS